MIEAELAEAKAKAERSGRAVRRFKDFKWRTRKSWSRKRRVIANAEWTQGEANPRFINVDTLRHHQISVSWRHVDRCGYSGEVRIRLLGLRPADLQTEFREYSDAPKLSGRNMASRYVMVSQLY